ncbi:unnamed protein product [Cunninghamella blakesleeana]
MQQTNTIIQQQSSSSTAVTAVNTNSITTIYCTTCKLPIEGDLDCQEPVASNFFPIELPDGSQKPLCEKDYFRRLNLVCSNCGDALKGSYTTAAGKKYHLEHFCCNICGEVLGLDYYEHNDNVYCHFHYSVKFATKCIGCSTAILKKFVETVPGEQWHPECYMIHKYWNVKLGGSSNNDQYNSDLSHLTATELLDHQLAVEEKVYRIWTVLTTFEDSSAACISEMLFHVSEGNYDEGTRKADFFIAHVEVLFCAIDELATNHMDILKVELNYDNEARMLCKKVTSFFSLLSHSQVGGLKRIGGTEDLVSSVTGLAQYLKVLIRLGLTTSLKLENTNNLNSGTIFKFLSQLVKVANIHQYYDLSQYTVTSDICSACQEVCDTQSYYYSSLRWHDKCFACSQCCLPLGKNYQDALLQVKDVLLYCKECGDKNSLPGGFEKLTKLQQLGFNLRVALKRLHLLLDVPVTPQNYYINDKMNQMAIQKEGGVTPNNVNNLNNNNHIQNNNNNSNKFINQMPEPPQQKDTVHLMDIKRTKSTHMNRNNSSSRRVAKRSTLMETPSPTSAFITNQQNDDQESNSISREMTSSPTKLSIDIQPKSSVITDNHQHDFTTTPISLSPTSTALPFKNIPPPTFISSSAQDRLHQFHKSRFYYFAELGSLDHYMLKHIAVLYLEEMMKDYFTLEELACLIDDKKQSTLWGKFVTSLKQGGNKKVPMKEGTFGVPLEILVEKYGVESNYGASPTRLKVPCVIEDCISAMKKMDVSVEGIFRLNGNIRKLKELSEEIDKNPTEVDYMKHNVIQLAALLKKFLRELPEPLLTFKLYKLFTSIQKLENEADRVRAMHLACCLLPKTNRDAMEVVFLFLKWVSTFAQTENGSGSKMDLNNITIMIAPNIFYPKGKDPNKEESTGVIETVSLLLRHQEEFTSVPEDFVPLLENLNYGEGDMELSVRNILKKCEVVMKMTRTQSAKHDQIIQQPTPPPLPRQHSSPAAVPTTSTILTSSPPPPPPISTDYHHSSPIDSYPIPTLSHHNDNNIDNNNKTNASTAFSPSSLPSSYCLSPSSMNNNTLSYSDSSHPEDLITSTPSSPSAAPPLPPVPLIRSQSSSIDTNNNLRKKPSLRV